MLVRGESTMAYKEPMLFGHPKYEVESAARTLEEARELEKSKPAIYAAALKHLKRKQNAIGDVLRAAKKTKKV
jgi:hypothetical protein